MQTDVLAYFTKAQADGSHVSSHADKREHREAHLVSPHRPPSAGSRSDDLVQALPGGRKQSRGKSMSPRL